MHKNLREVLERLARSEKNDLFRISYIYFNDKAQLVCEDGISYFPIDQAKELLGNPVHIMQGGATSIVNALSEVTEVFDDYLASTELPAEKKATIFLFTDGQENVGTKNDVIKKAMEIITYDLSPILATISFGADADEELLKEIACPPSDKQLRHLDMAGVLDDLPDRNKLFVQGKGVGPTLTNRKVEAIRMFVETLSKTGQEE